MSLKHKKMGKSEQRGGVIAALDVGTSKVGCLIAVVGAAAPGQRPKMEVTGIGLQLSQGVKSGRITDIEAVKTAIGAAVHTAEQMAKETIDNVICAMPGVQATSHALGAEVPIQHGTVSQSDIDRALTRAQQLEKQGEEELVHVLPVAYAIDGANSITDPVGLHGAKLEVALHAVTAPAAAIANLTSCVEHNHLEIGGLCLSAHAAGLSCLVPDEMELGAAVVDIGGGTCSIAIFHEGMCVWSETIPVGGAHVTLDVARGLTTPLIYAERLKTLYGAALPSASDERELIDVPLVGEEDSAQANHVPKSLLVGIIRPRMEEIFELVRARIEDSGFADLAGRRVVLTGGASQLPGTREMAATLLDRQVRMGRPTRIHGLAEAAAGPAFATLAGLLLYAADHVESFDRMAAPPAGGVFARMGHWLKENF